MILVLWKTLSGGRVSPERTRQDEFHGGCKRLSPQNPEGRRRTRSAIDVLKANPKKDKELYRKYNAAGDRVSQEQKGHAEEVELFLEAEETLSHAIESLGTPMPEPKGQRMASMASARTQRLIFLSTRRHN